MNTIQEKFTGRQVLRFIIPSLIGAFCFLCPVPSESGGVIIPIAYIISAINSFLGDTLIYVAMGMVIISAVLSIIGSVFHPKFMENNHFLKSIFMCKWIWVILRSIGALFVIMVYFNFGPAFIISADTGNFVLFSLLSSILTISFVAGLILPLLTDFGLMEFVGTILGKFFKKAFKIPGRAAVDCISSWLGDTSIAVVLTNGQMNRGFYTQREAATIATTFSAVSISFALVVISEVGMEEYFFQFYGIVCFVGIICALIVPRIPPLSKKPDTYIVEKQYDGEASHPESYTLLSWAYTCAVKRAITNGYTLKKYLTEGLNIALTVLLVLAPMIMCIGTLALGVAYFTTFLEIIGYPFIPLLKILQIPEAAAASQTMLAGFADMFIPAILAAGTISSSYTKFFIAVLSITQLLYLSENGSMILSTNMPLNILDLFLIFLERTLISIIATSLLIRLFLPGLLLM